MSIRSWLCTLEAIVTVSTMALGTVYHVEPPQYCGMAIANGHESEPRFDISVLPCKLQYLFGRCVELCLFPTEFSPYVAVFM
jgi:hypothetical protein